MRSILAIIPLLALAGCASIPSDEVRPVPGKRLLAYQESATGSSQLTVERDSGFLGAGCYVSFSIDRQVAARIAVSEEASFNVPPGTHVVGIGIDEQGEGLCSKGYLKRELAVTVAAGETGRFRILSDNRIGFDIRHLD
ncbi:3-isopropylmalate dehydratase [Pseudomonas schmalbachii]|uniref:3-isopropylmalate dehydratase n=1 Tax=Pseudomonas schmalbachii TaxID=2816993 RepID=A0ABS3TTG4_9PSED|nr:3-isopropylmalate dehydratase [Pseudomonas schmalbachii]MBO3276418.1 3-isopropylmalate dehydratase [Pseudomonas schmalbachii]